MREPHQQDVIDAMADGVIVTDAEGEIVVLNGAARRMLGLASAPAEGEPAITTAYLKSKVGFYPFELIQRPADCRPGTVLLREAIKVGGRLLHSVVTAANDTQGLLIVLRDTAPEGEALPSSGAEQHRDLLHPLRLPRAEIPATLFHELRTPMTSIAGALDLALGGHLGPLSRRQSLYLELAREACTRLGVVVDELVDTVKPSAGPEHAAVVLKPGAIDLAALVAENVARFGPAAAEKRVELTIRTREPMPPITGDRDRLSQVISNLLANALRFAPADEGEVLVELIASPLFPEVVALAIWNNGQPIPTDQHDELFDRLVGGTGLGLPISRGIIEAHGGAIWLEPGPANGARFVLTIPIAGRRLALTGAPTVEAALGEAAAELQRHYHSLAIARDRHHGYLVKGLLTLLGHDVLLAQDSEEALHLAQQHRPELILMAETRLVGASNGEADPARPHPPRHELDSLLAILKHDPETRQIPVASLLPPEADGVSTARETNGSGERGPDLHEPSSVSSDARDGGPTRSGRFVTASQPDAQWSGPFLTVALQGAIDSLIREYRRDRQAKILIVDDDVTVRMICRELLEAKGYLVREAVDGDEALIEARRFRPDLLILDVMMPGTDGFETATALRAESATAITPLIFLSARGQTADKVRAFKFGADDYMVKPFDAVELLARVEKALERAERELEASPTTRLPGSAAIESEVNRRLSSGQPLVLCYLDLDNLKAFNDHYGYAKADGVVRQTADLLREVVGAHGTRADFIGHIAGDDFVMVTSPDRIDRLAERIIEGFDRLAPLYYNKVDRQRGYIETHDRFGVLRRFPIISISLASLTGLPGRFRSHDELASAATDLKRQAKAFVGSSYVRDGVLRWPRSATTSSGTSELML